jgi:hypothetical protein
MPLQTVLSGILDAPRPLGIGHIWRAIGHARGAKMAAE